MLFDTYWAENIEPKISELYQCIEDDIRRCIKIDYKQYGSIVKRYGNWANFITKNMQLVEKAYNDKYIFRKRLYYRGQLVGEYDFILK